MSIAVEKWILPSSYFQRAVLSDHLHMLDNKVTSSSEALLSGRQVLFELDERCTQYISYRSTALLAHAGGHFCSRYGIVVHAGQYV